MNRRNPLDIELGDSVRNDLRKLAHRTFDFLVMLGNIKRNNQLENFVIGIVTLIAMVGVGAATWFGLRLAPPPLAGAAEIAGVIAALFSFIFVQFILGGILGGLTFRTVSRLAIYLWRRAPGKQADQRREKMLFLIGEFLKSNPGLPALQLGDQYGRDLRTLLPRALTAQLDRLKRTKGSLDYVIFRGLLERKYKTVYAAEGFHARRPRADDAEDPRSYYVRARDLRDALKVNLIFHYLGADLRDETPDGENWRREYFTAPERQHLTLWDESDLPTRFRTFAPHLRWPDDEQLARDLRPNSAGETATYLAIEGVENPLQIPLYLLTLEDIEAAMRYAAPAIDVDVETGKMTAEEFVRLTIDLLCNKPVPMFAKKDKNTLRALGGVDAPELTILRRGREDVLEIRWDPNRILWERLDPATSSALLEALALVLRAIDLCIDGDPAQGLAPSVKQVILKRGDLLITDNQRTLLCRRESDFYTVRRSAKLGAGMPPQWWLRGFYGFRIPQDIAAATARSHGAGADQAARSPRAVLPSVLAMTAINASLRTGLAR